uniref:Putative lipocalin-3 1 n=1 Tax=Amblyomma cajennense TaxID=34607 RepID=A0A023FQS2_AMBCJ
MAALWVFRGVVFSLLVATVLTSDDWKDRNEKIDFRQMLKKSSVIWVLNSTEQGNVKCRKDLITDVNNTHVSFDRYYGEGTGQMQETLSGKLFNWENPDNLNLPYDAIGVSKPGADPKIEEELDYLNKENSCAVVKVMNFATFNEQGMSHVWRELRVTARLLDRETPAECLKYYKDSVAASPKSSSRQVYFPDCPRSH